MATGTPLFRRSQQPPQEASLYSNPIGSRQQNQDRRENVVCLLQGSLPWEEAGEGWGLRSICLSAEVFPLQLGAKLLRPAREMKPVACFQQQANQRSVQL